MTQDAPNESHSESSEISIQTYMQSMKVSNNSKGKGVVIFNKKI